MSAKLALGSAQAVETSVTYSHGEKESCVVEVEGMLSTVSALDPANYCPSGYEVESSRVLSTGNSMGKLVINGIKYSSVASFSSVRTTFRVDMQEVQYDLEDHKYLADVRTTILAWLATDEVKRCAVNKYYYTNSEGTLTEITDSTAEEFCAAYMAGIKTFTRYFPVIEKVSTYKNPPGMLRGTGCNFTGGSPTFSSGVGKYNTPPLTLSGFAAANWFKSKDSWTENADRTWNRVEQWTYTPEPSDGDHAWIYNNIDG